jgi:hypothetical protein
MTQPYRPSQNDPGEEDGCGGPDELGKGFRWAHTFDASFTGRYVRSSIQR